MLLITLNNILRHNKEKQKKKLKKEEKICLTNSKKKNENPITIKVRLVMSKCFFSVKTPSS